MIVDYADSLTALTGAEARGALHHLSQRSPDRAEAFAADLWAACGHDAPPLAVDPQATADLPGPGWAALLVARGGRVSPYAALRDLTGRGAALPGPVACLTLAGGRLEGQHGRAWVGLPGNLHLSVAMPCDLAAAGCGPSLPMLPGVVLVEAVADWIGAPAARRAGLGLKWVNDVVCDDGAGGWRKIGGVLTAARADGPRITTVFFGLALNLAVSPDLHSGPFTLPAAALATVAPGVAPGVGVAARDILARLRERLADLAAAGPDALVSAYRQHSVLLGREVDIWDATARDRDDGAAGPPCRSGVVSGIRPDLGLELADQPEPVREGSLRPARRPGNR